jgi:hypothetical protein
MLSARSTQEALLYVELQPCGCGGSEYLPRIDTEQVGDHRMLRVSGRCSQCGRDRVYEFTVPAEQVAAPAFGNEQPSMLVDPGQFLWASDQAAARVPLDLTGLSDHAGAAGALRYAVATLEEVAKFIPAGTGEVPPAAFTSELGKALHRAEPHRFTVAELADRIASYRDGLDDLTTVTGGGR